MKIHRVNVEALQWDKTTSLVTDIVHSMELETIPRQKEKQAS